MIVNMGFVDMSADDIGVIALGEALGQLTAQTVRVLRCDLSGNKGLPQMVGDHIILAAHSAGLLDVLIGNMSFVGPRPDVPGYADKLTGNDKDVLKLRPGITGPATLKYRLEDEMISEFVAKRQAEGDVRPMQEIATEYNDTVIYPDKVRLNCYYYRHYSFIKDIEKIFATLLGFKVKFAGVDVLLIENN